MNMNMKLRMISIAVSFAIAGCASTGVVAVGQDTFMLAKTGGTIGMSGAEVTADLYREANMFCSEKKKYVSTVNVSALDWQAFVRMASSKLEFKCVDAVATK